MAEIKSKQTSGIPKRRNASRRLSMFNAVEGFFSSRVLRSVFDHSAAHKPSQSFAESRKLHLRYNVAFENRTETSIVCRLLQHPEKRSFISDANNL